MSCTIYVKTFRGKKIIPVDVDSEDMTVGQFRGRYLVGIVSREYRRLFYGDVLEDHKTLQDYGIKDKSTVTGIICLPGGERHTIHVKELTGETTPVDVGLKNMTIEEFKRRIDPQCKDCRLFYGDVLEDHKTLRDYGIKDKSTVIVFKRLPGGGERHTIYVQDLHGEMIRVDVDSEELKNMTVEELKRRANLQGTDYRLVYSGRQLEDHKTLQDYDIEHESTVFVVKRIRLPGGGERHTINVRGLTGKTTPVYVDSEELENMTVGELIRRLDPTGHGVKQYRLICGTRKLEEHKTLQDCGVEHGSRVFLIVYLPGGGGRYLLPEDEDEDEDRGIPRSQSMDNLLVMQKPWNRQ